MVRLLGVALITAILLGMGLTLLETTYNHGLEEGVVGDGRRYVVSDLAPASKIDEVLERISIESFLIPTRMDGAVLESATPIAATDYSRTNVQVMGIDEPDVVKTDGRFLYMAGWYGGGSQILIYTLGEEPGHVSTIRLENESISEILLAGDKLISISHLWIPVDRVEAKRLAVFSGYTSVRIFDVSNPWEPRELINMTFYGNYIDARLFLGRLYLFTYTYGLDKAIAEDLMERGDIYINVWREILYPGLWGIHVYSLDEGELEEKYVEAGPGSVYMTYDSAYLVTTIYRRAMIVPLVRGEGDTMFKRDIPRTEIVKIRLLDNGVDPVGSVILDGIVGDRLRVDEYGGYLRVAVHLPISSSWSEWETAIYVLDSGSLRVVGYIGGLGKGEMLYGVRFLGRYAYLVTFRVVDPFYVVDLGIPTNPVVLGVLKIPGFSTLLQPLWNGLVLGIGFNATEEGRVTGLKASVYDVKNPLIPRELVSVPLDTAWTEALYNINALTLDPRRGIAIVPLKKYLGMSYDVAALVVDTGSLRIETISYRVDCNTPCIYSFHWVRSVYAGDYLYLIGMDRIGVFTYPGLKKVGIITVASG